MTEEGTGGNGRGWEHSPLLLLQFNRWSKVSNGKTCLMTFLTPPAVFLTHSSQLGAAIK